MNRDEIALPLDADEGPAPRLDAEGYDALSASILEAWQPSAAPRRARSVLALGVALGFVLAGGLASALWIATRPVTPPAPAPAPAPVPAPPAPPPVQTHARPPEAPVAEPVEAAALARPEADLLASANRARAAGDYRRAGRLYRSAARGRGPSAYAAAVAAGQLDLEHLDRPGRAARLFGRALRLQARGPLDLAAREGLVLAARRRGRVDAERRAIEALIAQHPESAAARRAHARLEEIR